MNNETLKSCLAAGAGCGIWDSGFNVLDCLRVRWQVHPSTTMPMTTFTLQIIRNEGLWSGLWKQAILTNGISGFTNGCIKMGLYPFVRDWLKQGGKKKPVHMVTAGFFTGGVGYWLSTPLFQARIRLQAQLEKKSGFSPKPFAGTLDFIRRTYAIEGIRGLFRGASVLCMRGALLTAGHLLGYDATKDIMKDYGVVHDGPMLHLLSSASAAILAALFCMPADYTLTRYVSLCDRGFPNVSIIQLILDEHAKHGVLRFYRGLSLLTITLFPILTFYNLTYEQMRLLLGIGYMD